MSAFVSLTPNRVQDLLVKVFEQISGFPEGRVLVSTKIDQRPQDGPYCTLYFKTYEPLRQDDGYFIYPADPADPDDPDPGDPDPDESDADESNPDESDSAIQIQKHTTRVTVEITFRGEEAFFKANEARQQLQSAQRFTDLWRLLGYSGASEIRDLSDKRQGKIQQRASFEFSFYVNLYSKCPADWFERAFFTIDSHGGLFEGNG